MSSLGRSAASLELPERLPEPGELVGVRSRRWLVDEVVTDPSPAVVRLACADDDAQGEELEVLWDYELDRRITRGGGLGRPGGARLRRAAPVRGLSEHAAVELRHRDRPEPVPVAVPRRNQDRRLPDGAAAQGAAAAAREPVHRRRRRPRQDDRGRADRARAAAAQEGARRSSSRRRRRCSSSGRPSWRSASGSTFEILDRALRRRGCGASAGSASTRGRRTAASWSRTTC